MSPVGGVGINYAIQDAVVAANVLGNPLCTGRLRVDHLAKVQCQRQWPTRIVQGLQAIVQKQLIARALDLDQVLKPPGCLRLPIFCDLPARLIAFGVWPVHLRG